MTYSGELGVIIEFFENAVASYDFDTLAQHTLDACSKFGIESSLQIRPGNDLLEWSSTGAVCPLESQLLERGAQSKRIVTHKDYMFFNAPEITLLLKKLPLDDSDKVGRIRDHAAIIIKGLEAQIKVIQSRQASKKRRATAIDTLSNKSMSLIENLLNESTQFSHDIEEGYDELQVRIKETAAINELDTSQEQAILEDVAGYAKKMKAALIFVEHFNEAMTDLTWQLNEISKMD